MRYLIAVAATLAVFAHGAYAQSNNSSSTALSSSTSGSLAESAGAAVVNQTSNLSGTSTIHNTPDVNAPGLYGGTNNCLVSGSGGVSVAGFGLSGGGMWEAQGCERRNDAVILFEANLPTVAVAMLCQDDETRNAFMAVGKPCPADRQPGVVYPAYATVAVSSAVAVTRPKWCNSMVRPEDSDVGPDATTYRYYCK